MKRTALALTLIIALLISAVVGINLVGLTSANPMGLLYPWDPEPRINVLFPQNSTTCQATSFQLNFTLDLSEWYDYDHGMNPEYSFSLGPVEYYLDGVLAGQITGHLSKEPYNLTVALSGLTQGLHSVEVNATTRGEYWNQTYESNGPHANYVNGVTNGTSGLVYFTVDTIPSISILSLENKTYYGLDVPLSFKVNEDVSEITYSLDGQENVTIAGNTTLTDLLEGEHNITVYAVDEGGNTGASETIYFRIAEEQELEPFPTLWVAALVATVAIIGSASAIYYFTRPKRINDDKHGSIVED